MHYLAAAIVVLMSLTGVALTLLTLPGIWVMIAAAAACTLWQPGLMSWWTIGACVAIALLAEAAEFAACAVGARTTGGSRSSAVGSIVGALIGAVAGTPFVPPIGTVVGAIVGAGLGALAAERGIASGTWKGSTKVAGGAAAGRAAGLLIKTIGAVAIGAVLCVAVFVP
ncbi:MAG: DUF456 domain-containing protein [Phycisphaeraceae bacterium]|nr:DUF456 domain-containing protein [Phycisphaerae bacterium]MBX3392707.1 DUF456 domain-containing protein [Phycisphaeraceae bacterium]